MKIIPTFEGEIGLSLSEEEVRYLFFATAEYEAMTPEEREASRRVCMGLYAIVLKMDKPKEDNYESQRRR